MTDRPARRLPAHELLLLGLIAVEVVVFGYLGDNFLTAGNLFEVIRLSVEVGLLAVALTPVIVSGGIDLSVGSLMGLVAVAFGYLCVGQGWPWGLASVAALGVGAAAGAVNGLLISRLRLPALIVTLGTYSLYRGLAEGATGAILNYTALPAEFLRLGQGYLAGGLPCQVPLFALVVATYALLLHRTVYGRAIYAIGHSPDGARFAGLPVRRQVCGLYVLSGLVCAVATLVYVARVGQAKADAGLGYELIAITAVVLGGTAIEGGRGGIAGTLLGLLVIVILENGLRLAALPAELAGVLTGCLLLGAIAAPRLARLVRDEGPECSGEVDMKNWQVAALSAAMLVSALIVAGSNLSVARQLARPPAPATPAASVAVEEPPASRITVAMMPKSKGDPYFVSCRRGAEDAAAELGVELIWDGPTETDAAKQNEVVEAFITKGVDVIAVSVQNPEAIATVLRKARAKGIKVLTWDADATEDARDYLINQATPQGIGYTLVDEAARVLGGSGKFAIITSTLTAANQNEWIKYIKERLTEHPGLELVTIKPGEDMQERAMLETQNVLKAYPEVKLIMAISAPAVPGAADAVKASGRSDVKVIGLSLPNMCKPYVHQGIVDCVVLWNTYDLGYLTIRAARAVRDGTLKPGDTQLDGGKLGPIEVAGTQVLLGQPFVFTKDNIDQFDF